MVNNENKHDLLTGHHRVTEDIKVTLWKSADKLRAQMDAAEYKHIVLGLIFLKYISDSFTAQQEKICEMASDPNSDYFISEIPTIDFLKYQVNFNLSVENFFR